MQSSQISFLLLLVVWRCLCNFVFSQTYTNCITVLSSFFAIHFAVLRGVCSMWGEWGVWPSSMFISDSFAGRLEYHQRENMTAVIKLCFQVFLSRSFEIVLDFTYFLRGIHTQMYNQIWPNYLSYTQYLIALMYSKIVPCMFIFFHRFRPIKYLLFLLLIVLLLWLLLVFIWLGQYSAILKGWAYDKMLLLDPAALKLTFLS